MNVNLKQQNVGKTTYLVWNIGDENLKIDTFAMNMMSYNHMIHLIPTQIVKNDDRRQVQFDITGLTRMSSVMAEVKPKQEVLLLFNSILNAYEEAEDYMLDPDHLLLDWEYVYLDVQRNCKLLYLPFVKVAGIGDRIDFLREAVSRIKPDYQDGDTYLYDLLNAFSRGAVHTNSDFRELIKKSAGTPIQRRRKEIGVEGAEDELPHTPYRIASTATDGPLNKPKKSVQDRKTSVNSSIPVMNIPGREPGAKATSQKPPKEKKSHFSIGISKKPKEKPVESLTEDRLGSRSMEGEENTAGLGRTSQNTVDLQNEMYERDEGTVIMQALFEEQKRNKNMETPWMTSARLIRKRSGASYPVNGDRVTIGSSAAVNICIDCNNTISREHALILYMDGRYYVEDHQSRNGTFINGIRLQTGIREPIYNGMMIRLSNEEFEFVMS